MNKVIPATLLLLLSSAATYGQDKKDELDDIFMSQGKIYVVFGVALVIFLGILIYLFLLERKVSRLERKLQNKSK